MKNRLETLATYAIATILALAAIILATALVWSTVTENISDTDAALAASSINATATTVLISNLATQK